MLPEYYEFYNPVKINAGREALETIPYELKLLNVKRPIIITDKGIVNAGLLKIFLDLSVLNIVKCTGKLCFSTYWRSVEVFNSTGANSKNSNKGIYSPRSLLMSQFRA